MVITSNNSNRIFPKIQQIDNYRYQLVEDYHYIHRDQFEIVVKAGYIFDGASIPRPLWGISGSPFTGAYTVAALIHDAIYSCESFTRAECDRIFREIMLDWGVWRVSAYAKWAAVRLFGWLTWAGHDNLSISHSIMFVKIN